MNNLFFAKIILYATCVVAIQSFSLDPVDYLTKYGYLSSKIARSGRLQPIDDIKNSITNFQRMAGIPITGKMDNRTEEKMQLPRCGLKEHIGDGQKHVTISKWEKRNLTYRVLQYTTKLKQNVVDRIIAKAFSLWEKHADLTFTHMTSGPVDIEIRFSYYYGPYNQQFDGTDDNPNILAYAYYPQNGDIYFDESENWSIFADYGISLFYTAVHEIGHSLGMAHSQFPNSVMTPIVNKQYHDLYQDDIQGIQLLYGPKKPKNPSPPQNNQRPQNPWNVPTRPNTENTNQQPNNWNTNSNNWNLQPNNWNMNSNNLNLQPNNWNRPQNNQWQ